jgi:hypothetical protein
VLIVEEGATFRGVCNAGESTEMDQPAWNRDEEPVEVK